MRIDFERLQEIVDEMETLDEEISDLEWERRKAENTEGEEVSEQLTQRIHEKKERQKDMAGVHFGQALQSHTFVRSIAKILENVVVEDDEEDSPVQELPERSGVVRTVYDNHPNDKCDGVRVHDQSASFTQTVEDFLDYYENLMTEEFGWSVVHIEFLEGAEQEYSHAPIEETEVELDEEE